MVLLLYNCGRLPVYGTLVMQKKPGWGCIMHDVESVIDREFVVLVDCMGIQFIGAIKKPYLGSIIALCFKRGLHFGNQRKRNIIVSEYDENPLL